jgi:hypothetical protein
MWSQQNNLNKRTANLKRLAILLSDYPIEKTENTKLKTENP